MVATQSTKAAGSPRRHDGRSPAASPGLISSIVIAALSFGVPSFGVLSFGVLALAILLPGIGAPAVAASATYVYDPPPAEITPLSAAALQQAESDPDLISAWAAVTAGNGAAATAAFDRAIAKGNVVAMVQLADLQDHPNEIGVRIDNLSAKDLYRRAALLGYALGQQRFGKIYADGDGVPADLIRAYAWYRFAAEQGQDTAAALMGTAYLAGGPLATTGAAADGAKAFHYASLGESQDGANARFLLAMLYELGIGVSKDPVRGFHLMLQAGEQGNIQARFALVQIYHFGIGTERDQAQADHWDNRAIEGPRMKGQVWLDVPMVFGQ